MHANNQQSFQAYFAEYIYVFSFLIKIFWNTFSAKTKSLSIHWFQSTRQLQELLIQSTQLLPCNSMTFSKKICWYFEASLSRISCILHTLAVFAASWSSVQTTSGKKQTSNISVKILINKFLNLMLCIFRDGCSWKLSSCLLKACLKRSRLWLFLACFPHVS